MGAGEVEACVALHRAAFDSRNMTVEWRARILVRPEYRSELDCVAVAPDGRLAAFGIGWLDRSAEPPRGPAPEDEMILALKLLLTPFLIAAATLVGRRWGPQISGWLIGFPFTSGSVSVILALQTGPEFAARAAVGILGGAASVCVFCLAYSATARRRNWMFSLVVAILAFLLATLVWNSFTLSLLPTFIVVMIVEGLVVRAIPARAVASAPARAPRWDLQARMLMAVAFVVLMTAIVCHLGPQLSGLITPFPIFASVLAPFAHRQQGADAATQFLRGLAAGLFGFAGFFLVVGALLPGAGIVWVYAMAAFVAVVCNGVSWRATVGTSRSQLSDYSGPARQS
jgi:hypothetical protein